MISSYFVLTRELVCEYFSLMTSAGNIVLVMFKGSVPMFTSLENFLAYDGHPMNLLQV